jgi:hypothetical protein
VGKVNIEVNQVKGKIKKCKNKLEREMTGVKQQFENERKEQDLKVQQLAEHQEAEILSVKQQVDINKVEINNAVVEVR